MTATTRPAPVHTPPHQRRSAPNPYTPDEKTAPSREADVTIAYEELLDLATGVFIAHRVPPHRAREAARALCYGDLTGMDSHGLANLSRQYLPLFEHDRVDPTAEPETLADLGAAVLLDARHALGLWQATEAMDLAVERAAEHGIGLVSVRGATHFGCAGYHALRAVDHGMIGIVASNCGGQRLARPPGGAVTMLGTNPLSIAAPAGQHPPFVLDMSTTAAPTGRVRAAARLGRTIPAGWLVDEHGAAATDPAAFDRGDAHLQWLGAPAGAAPQAAADAAAHTAAHTGAFKGFGLGLMVEVLAALVSGSQRGPSAEALSGDGRPTGRDDDIGFFVLAIAPGLLRNSRDLERDAEDLFGALLQCPPADPTRTAGHPGYPGYPGTPEAARAASRREHGVPLDPRLHAELVEIADRFGLPIPTTTPTISPAPCPTQDGER